MSQQLSQQSPALAPLSRDHLLAIQQAKVLQQASRSSVQDQDNVVQKLAMFWKEEMEPHFLNEERILQQFIADKEFWNKLVEDHRIICNLTKRIIFSDEIRCSELLQLGELIERHYVWEDEVLFPYLLKSLDNSSQIRLLHQTHIWEAVRSRNQKSH